MYRFTIRDVLWLTVLVALGLGWWLERRRANYFESDSAYLREAIARAGYIPDGNYVGPTLSRKRWDTEATPSDDWNGLGKQAASLPGGAATTNQITTPRQVWRIRRPFLPEVATRNLHADW